jgi:hypothetical protein
MKLGDSIRRRIDDGLVRSRYGVVVLSQAFFAKNWPQYELDGLIGRENASGEKVVLPVWHGVDKNYVARYSPTLADRLAVSSAEGVDNVFERITSVLGSPRSINVPSVAASAMPVISAVLDLPLKVIDAAVGAKMNEPAVNTLLGILGSPTSVFQGQNAQFYQYPHYGLSLTFDTPSHLLSAVTLIVGKDTTIKPYGGKLPCQLEANDTREAVEQKLGKPAHIIANAVDGVITVHERNGLMIEYVSASATDMTNTLSEIVIVEPPRMFRTRKWKRANRLDWR